MAAARFIERLNEQIAYEFSASQQYVANAVYYDAQTLLAIRRRLQRARQEAKDGNSTGT